MLYLLSPAKTLDYKTPLARGVAARATEPLLAATLLTVFGVWQREGEVRHLIAHRLVDHSALLQGLVSKSRDFH